MPQANFTCSHLEFQESTESVKFEPQNIFCGFVTTREPPIHPLLLFEKMDATLMINIRLTKMSFHETRRTFRAAASPLHCRREREVSASWRCCGKLPSNTGCGQRWRTVRASGCWLSHLSWTSQQDVTAALSLLPADHWAWHPLHSPALSPPPPYLHPSPHSHLKLFAARMRINGAVSKRRDVG